MPDGFVPIEDDMDAEKAFLDVDYSDVSTEDLLKKLEALRSQRGAQPKSVRKSKKKENEAKMIAEFMAIIPEEMRDTMAALSNQEKLKVLRSIAKNKDETQNKDKV